MSGMVNGAEERRRVGPRCEGGGLTSALGAVRAERRDLGLVHGAHHDILARRRVGTTAMNKPQCIDIYITTHAIWLFSAKHLTIPQVKGGSR